MTTVDLTEEGEQRVVDACVEHVEPLREAIVALQRYVEAVLALRGRRSVPYVLENDVMGDCRTALDAAKRAEVWLDACDTDLEQALGALGYTR